MNEIDVVHALNFGFGNSQVFFPYKLLVITTLLYTISACKRFHRNALLLNSQKNLYSPINRFCPSLSLPQTTHSKESPRAAWCPGNLCAAQEAWQNGICSASMSMPQCDIFPQNSHRFPQPSLAIFNDSGRYFKIFQADWNQNSYKLNLKY